ncbi:hypothetical protein FJZ17_02105 [Candidatus Pacearchaeota archaeon]|nr:hypothetical protein [Candidatus Pacearchaeota archaeon]
MGFFKKSEPKRVELPEINNSLELPELPKDNNSIPPLPTFPKNQVGNNLGLQAIKSSVSDESETPGYTIEEDNEKRTLELSDLPEPLKPEMKRYSIDKEPIFIKLDKFKDAVEKFQQVKEKVIEIEETLRKIKDIKDKEDIELKSWEEEVMAIKEKVENIDSSLFNKI